MKNLMLIPLLALCACAAPMEDKTKLRCPPPPVFNKGQCPKLHVRTPEEIKQIHDVIEALPPGSPVAPAAFEWERLRRETELCNAK